MPKKYPLRELTHETYTVGIARHKKTGAVIYETWTNANRRLHRPIQDGPATFERDPKTGAIDFSSPDTDYWLHGHIVDQKTGEEIPVAPKTPRAGKKTTPVLDHT